MRTITIGRSNKCDIIIPDESVSSIHAEIMRCCQGKAIYLPSNLLVWMLGDNPASSKERQTPDKKDKLGIDWGILSIFIPLVSWIMYFVWKDEIPKCASLAGALGTISFVINIISNLNA